MKDRTHQAAARPGPDAAPWQAAIAAAVGLAGIAAASSPAVADPCRTPTQLVEGLWSEYERHAEDLGCDDGCFDDVGRYESIIREIVQAWESGSGNSWATLGPRRLDVGDVQFGTVVQTRKFVSPPLNGPLEVEITKEGGRARTDVFVCKYAADAVDGETLWSLDVGGGTGTIGNTWTNGFADTSGHIVAITFKAGPGLQVMKYALKTSVAEPSPPADDGRGLVTVEPDTDRPGSDYRSFDLAAADPDRCANTCENEARCEAYTYVPPGRQAASARCWLKDSVPRARTSQGNVSGVKGSPMPQNMDVNRGGRDYRNFAMAAAEPTRCAEACADESRCRAYTYVPPGRQGPAARCWLKDGVPPASDADGLVSGVK